MAMASVKGENVTVSAAAAPRMKKLASMLCMKGGNGDGSYLNNSQAQALHARRMLHFLEETLDAMMERSSSDKLFTAADLGCSCGSNSLFIVDVIVRRVSEAYESRGRDAPEFQVPEEVGDSASPAYNGGRVFVHRATEAVAAAYKRQFQADLARFLRSRAREMKRGGAMFLACLGRSSGDPADQGGAGLLFGTHFQDAWDDLVQEGVVEGEKRDSFNIPVYAPSLQEFRDVVRADGAFAIDRLELVRGGSPLVVDRPDDTAEVGRAMANSCKAVAGVLVDAHIGERRGAQLFERLERRAARHARELVEKMHFFHVVCSLSLAP
uniref:Jasmonate O-methyltransferase n=1 Tax=Oryza nivara TaxID=4536 RepID=A0A0E0H743_ORYNI